MSRRARPSQKRRPPALPAPRPAPVRQQTEESEVLLLDQIVAGALDAHLTAIAEAIHARSVLVQTVNSAKALAQLAVWPSPGLEDT